MSWPGGCHQLVALESFEFEKKEFVRFVTRIDPAQELGGERLTLALRVNPGLAHGALAILHDALVMLDTQLLQNAETEEIKASIDYLARNADSYEQSLFGRDAD